jgi:asparagine N-glycosylation enzyme membrane subunit Stt3
MILLGREVVDRETGFFAAALLSFHGGIRCWGAWDFALC